MEKYEKKKSNQREDVHKKCISLTFGERIHVNGSQLFSLYMTKKNLNPLMSKPVIPLPEYKSLK